MLFSQRALEPEHFDDPARTAAEITACYQELGRVNRLFRLDDPYTRVMARWLGHDHCQNLSILDLGAGDSWLGTAMEAWARKEFGWEWRVTNLDLNLVPLQLNQNARNVVGSVLALPFTTGSFDLVIASQMTHHLPTDDNAVQHFREAYRVARQGVFITDMKRSAIFYAALWVTLRVLRLSRETREDGLLSVKRSWSRKELIALAGRAGLRDATVRSYFGSRLIVAARKT